MARGACALKYQDTVLLNLMFIAELAAMQGYDAYALSVDGKTLHTAVKFLLDAVDDPSVVLQYAYQDPANCINEPPLPTIGLRTVVEAARRDQYTAWLEPYIARFPDHPNSARLRNLLRGRPRAESPDLPSSFRREHDVLLRGREDRADRAGWQARQPPGPVVGGAGGVSRAGASTSRTRAIRSSPRGSPTADGKPWWLIAQLEKSGAGVYAGPVWTMAGSPWNSNPFDASKVRETEVGSATATFASGSSTESFAYTVNGTSQTKTIVPQEFPKRPTCAWGVQADLTLATNFTDLWWNPGESGWGINFSHQADTIFGTWFTYDTAGKPWWLIAQLEMSGAGVYAGPVWTMAGSPWNLNPFDASKVRETEVGSATATFANGSSASFAYTVNDTSQIKAITRQVFAPPGTVCQ